MRAQHIVFTVCMACLSVSFVSSEEEGGRDKVGRVEWVNKQCKCCESTNSPFVSIYVPFRFSSRCYGKDGERNRKNKLLEIADAGAKEMKMSNAKRYVAGLGKNG